MLNRSTTDPPQHRSTGRGTVVLNGFATRGGGAAIRLQEVARRLVEWGVDVVVIRTGDLPIDLPGVPQGMLPGRLDRLPVLLRRTLEAVVLWRTCRERDVGAVVHYGSFLPLGARTAVGTDHILYFTNLAPWGEGRGSGSLKSRALRLLFRLTAGNAAVIVVQSEATRDFLAKRYPAIAGRLHVVVNGCSVPPLSRPRHCRDFLLIGDVHPYRRYDEIVRAYADLPAEVRAQHRLVIVGSLDADRRGSRALLRAIRQHGVSGQVQLLGAVDRSSALNLLAGAGAYVSYAAIENGPNALLEALAVGVQTILSDIPVHREFAGSDALYADDVASLTEAFLAAAQRNRRGRDAATVPPCDSWPRHVNDFADVLRRRGILAAVSGSTDAVRAS